MTPRVDKNRDVPMVMRVPDVARELGVDAQVIRRWQDQVKVDVATAFPGNGRRARQADELQRLRKEVVQLRAERDFLKKAAAFFAKGSR